MDPQDGQYARERDTIRAASSKDVSTRRLGTYGTSLFAAKPPETQRSAQGLQPLDVDIFTNLTAARTVECERCLQHSDVDLGANHVEIA